MSEQDANRTAMDSIMDAMGAFQDAEPEKVIIIWASGNSVCYKSNCRPFEAFGLCEAAKDYIMGRPAGKKSDE